MNSPEFEDINNSLKEISELSVKGEITWLRVNPSTFMWVKKWDLNEGSKTTIQKIAKKSVKSENGKIIFIEEENFIFQVTDVKNNSQMLIINSEDQPEFREILSKIFDIAGKRYTQKGLDFLKKTLEAPTNK